MQYMHFVQKPSEPTMQSSLLSNLPLNTDARLKKVEGSDKSAPFELDLAELTQVAGGLSPKGTWAADKTTAEVASSPKGTW
jgi:hypothetical protein